MPIPVVEVPIRPIQTIRLGRLSATPDFLDEIPSGIMARALRSHSRAVSETLETRHGFEGVRFPHSHRAGRKQDDDVAGGAGRVVTRH